MKKRISLILFVSLTCALLLVQFTAPLLAASDVFFLPPGDPRSGPMTQFEFDQINSEFVTKVWVEHMQTEDLSIYPRFEWENPYMMASSNLRNSQFSIILAGALARLPLMNPLGIAFILCHELGHLKGGLPRIVSDPDSAWASAEGQSDYWAARVCLPEFLKRSPHLFSKTVLSKKSQEFCKTQFDDAGQLMMCAQTLTAGETFFKATNLWPTPGSDVVVDVSYELLDETRVNQVERSYPSHQCRFQTILAGATHQDRPRCWYSENP